jgi:hypothetical protein
VCVENARSTCVPAVGAADVSEGEPGREDKRMGASALWWEASPFVCMGEQEPARLLFRESASQDAQRELRTSTPAEPSLTLTLSCAALIVQGGKLSHITSNW